MTHHVSTTKKFIGLVILTAFFLSPALAENGTYGFTLSPYIGILYGHSEEIVYKDPPEQNLYLSELLWDLKPLLYVGLGAEYAPPDRSVTKGLTAALSFKAGLPTRTGILEDRDWQSPPNRHYLTHYSQHDTYSGTTILLDASAGYFWRFTGSLVFSIYGEFSFMHFSWSGKDGYFQYASQIPGSSDYYSPWDSGIGKNSYNGEVIRYNQNWFILSPGVSLDWDMNRLFSVKAFINYSPLVYCADRDDHLVSKKIFLDYLSFGNYFKVGGELILSPSQNTGISLFASYKHISGTRGDTYVGGMKIPGGDAGAGLSAPELGLAVKYKAGSRK